MTETRDTAGALTSEEPPSLTEAIGGSLGAAESPSPAAAYVLAYTVSGQDSTVALIVAGALGVLFAIARMVRRRTVEYARSPGSSASRSRPTSLQDRPGGGLFPARPAGQCRLRGRVPDLDLRGLAAARRHRRTLRGTGMGWREEPSRSGPTPARAGSGSASSALRLAVQLPLYLASARHGARHHKGARWASSCSRWDLALTQLG